MQWYPHYTGDYKRATEHLSLLEHGAYRLLLDHYYDRNANAHANALRLHTVCKAHTDAEREAVDFVVQEFFTIENGKLRHARADKEIAKRNDRSAKARKSAAQRWGKGDEDECERICDRNANAYPNAMLSTTTSTTTSTSRARTKDKDAPAKSRGTLIAFGEFGKVKLTEAEYAKLSKKHGDEKARAAVDVLDAWIERTGKRRKNHYACLKDDSWVWDKVGNVVGGSEPEFVSRFK